MSGEGRYWVTPSSGPPYQVALRTAPGGWEAVVERDGERWTFPLTGGAGDDLAWCGDRAVRFHWDPGLGTLALAGWTHELIIETDAAHRIAELGLAGGSSGGPARVRAPMPGLVLAVEVAEGARVSEGQGIMIIEAMKMENEIRAPAAGVVRELAVAAGDTVERDALLFLVDPEAT